MFKPISQFLPQNTIKFRLKEVAENLRLFKKAEIVLKKFGFNNAKATAFKNKVLIIKLDDHSVVNDLKLKEKDILKKIEMASGEKIDSVKYKVISEIKGNK